MNITMNITDKKNEILRISKLLGLTHIGSNLSVLPILEHIYKIKSKNDKVVLDNAHAHLAHLVVQGVYNPEALIHTFGIHCDWRAGCDASGGSLGHGLGISIGLALTDRRATVFCVVSDGSMMEGSNWEALRIIADQKIDNVRIICNFNGATAVSEVSPRHIYNRMLTFVPEMQLTMMHTKNGEGFEGVQGHYKKL